MFDIYLRRLIISQLFFFVSFILHLTSCRVRYAHSLKV